MWKYYNANTLGNSVNDCVVRAISLVEGKSWDKTYKELSEIARKEGILLDDVNFVEPLLDSRYNRVKTFYKETIQDFLEMHPKGTYLITMPNHITVLRNGTIYDTFDCRDRVLRDVWEVSKE